jgi:hypothetical protein
MLPIFKKFPDIFRSLGRFTSSVSRDMVYKTVKILGGKFKPWGASKLTKFINKLGPILAVIGSILEALLTIKEEKDKEKYEQELCRARAEIRQRYREIASEIQNAWENGGEDENGDRYDGLNKRVFKDIYEQELREIEKLRNELMNTQKSKEEIVKQLKNLLKDIKEELSSLTE